MVTHNKIYFDVYNSFECLYRRLNDENSAKDAIIVIECNNNKGLQCATNI